jgi:hypothetical protein
VRRLRVRLLGSGTPADPYHVDLPNYTMVGEPDLVSQIVEVEVPDIDAPLQHGRTNGGAPSQPLSHLTATDHDAWHAQLDARYAEHAGRFRPEVR